MYLQKAMQYQGGVYFGADESGNLYRGVVDNKMTENIKFLGDAGFTVRTVIADNHSTNVTAFSKLLKGIWL